MILYVIYDKVADEFGPIFEAKNDMVASRNYAGVIKPHMEHDFALYAIGERCDTVAEAPDVTKVIEAYDFPRKVQVEVNFSQDNKLAVVEVNNVK